MDREASCVVTAVGEGVSGFAVVLDLPATGHGGVRPAHGAVGRPERAEAGGERFSFIDAAAIPVDVAAAYLSCWSGSRLRATRTT